MIKLIADFFETIIKEYAVYALGYVGYNFAL